MYTRVLISLLLVLFTEVSFCNTTLNFPREEKALIITNTLAQIKKDENHINGTAMIQQKSVDGLTSFLANIYINKSNMSTKDIRNLLLNSLKKNQKIQITGLKTYEKNNDIYYEYILKKINGSIINQKNIGRIFSYREYIVAANASKAFYEKKDQKQIEQLINNIEIKNTSYNIYENMVAGAACQIKNESAKAQQFYENALSLYKQGKTEQISKETMVALADALGIIYFNNKQYKDAENLYQYMTSIVEKNPTVYYHLAEAHAAQNDYDKTIENIEQAYSLQKNISKESNLPNPFENKYLKKYKSAPSFIDTVKSYL